MGENTKIEWAHHTFNPWYGCQRVGPGCDHCYAEGWAKRSGLVQWGVGADRRRSSAANWRKPLLWNRQAEIAIEAWEKFKATQPGLTDQALGAQGFVKPTRPRVFCASLADVFDNAVPAAWRADLFRVILQTPYLDWLLVTKRIGNAYAMINRAMWQNSYNQGMNHSPPDNVWLGITVCNQAEADRDIPKLLTVPASVRFLSMEPLLGAVDIARWLDDGSNEMALAGTLNWIVAGGESGPKARPTHTDWVRSLRDQCAAAGVPFLFKQWGEWAPSEAIADDDERKLAEMWIALDGRRTPARRSPA